MKRPTQSRQMSNEKKKNNTRSYFHSIEIAVHAMCVRLYEELKEIKIKNSFSSTDLRT